MKATLTATFTFLITTLVTYGQQSAFFDLQKKSVTETSEAHYVRQIAPMADTIYIVVDSYLSGLRASVGFTHEPKQAYEKFNYLKDGQYFTYNDSNRVRKLELYHKGKKQGDQFSYGDDGNMKSWSYFHDNKPYFISTYYESGAVEDSISYDYSGEKVKMQRLCYHPNGLPERIDLLEDDVLIEGKCFNDKGEESAYIPFEEMPEFPGGQYGLSKYLSRMVRYPIHAERQGIEGRVYVTFVVDGQGGVGKPEILRGAHPDLDNEALRVISRMPNWKPGQRKGVPVAVNYTLPINFSLTRE